MNTSFTNGTCPSCKHATLNKDLLPLLQPYAPSSLPFFFVFYFSFLFIKNNNYNIRFMMYVRAPIFDMFTFIKTCILNCTIWKLLCHHQLKTDALSCKMKNEWQKERRKKRVKLKTCCLGCHNCEIYYELHDNRFEYLSSIEMLRKICFYLYFSSSSSSSLQLHIVLDAKCDQLVRLIYFSHSL